MDSKTYNGVTHYVYDKNTVPDNLKVVENWRKGEKGDWIRLDDGGVCQVLDKVAFKANKQCKEKQFYCLKTICGFFHTTYTKETDSDVVATVGSFSGKDYYQHFKNKEKLTTREQMFVRYIIQGKSPRDAYLKAYITKNKQFAEYKARILLSTDRIKKMIDEEIKQALADEGITYSFLLRAAKRVVELTEKDSDRMRGIEYLSKVNGMLEKESSKESLTLVQGGFSSADLERIVGKPEPKQLENGNAEK